MNFSLFGCRYGRYVIYQKYVVSVMACTSMIILYGNRYALPSTAHRIMVIKTEKRKQVTDGICPKALLLNDTKTILADRHIEWSPEEKYYVDAGFFAAYTLAHVPAGIACDLYGAKHFVLLGVLASGILTIIQPFLLIYLQWYYSLINQSLNGALQGMSMSAIMSLASYWIPKRQMTFLVCLVFCGPCLGNTFSTLITWIFTNYASSWKGPYFFWGSMSVTWFLIFMYSIYSRTTTHPFVCIEEKLQIEKEIGTELPKKVPWKSLLTDSAVWAIVAGQIGHNYLTFTLDLNLAVFMKKVIGANVDSSPITVITPQVVLCFSILICGYWADYLINMRYVPILYLRTLLTTTGNLVPSVLILIGTYIGCNEFVVIIFFSLAMIFKGAMYPGLKTNILDITRHYAGFVSALHNGLPSIAGIINPKIINYMCRDNTVYEWRKVFWMCLAINLFTTTLYIVWCRADRAEWDTCKHEDHTRSRRIT